MFVFYIAIIVLYYTRIPYVGMSAGKLKGNQHSSFHSLMRFWPCKQSLRSLGCSRWSWEASSNKS